MMKVKVTRVAWKRDIETPFGKKDKIGIQTSEHGDKWLGAFANDYNKKKLEEIKEGDEIQIKVWNKGDFINFKLADRFDVLEERVRVLEAAIGTGDTEEPTEEVVSEQTTEGATDEMEW